MVEKGLYRHFKGGVYRVIDIATHTETEEPMVIYRSENQPERLWARPLSMWEETVIRDGQQYKRFTQIEEDTDGSYAGTDRSH